MHERSGERGRNRTFNLWIGSAKLETLNYLQFQRFPSFELSGFRVWFAKASFEINDIAAVVSTGFSYGQAGFPTVSLKSLVFELACAARVFRNNVAITEKLVFIRRQSFEAHRTAGMKLTGADP